MKLEPGYIGAEAVVKGDLRKLLRVCRAAFKEVRPNSAALEISRQRRSTGEFSPRMRFGTMTESSRALIDEGFELEKKQLTEDEIVSTAAAIDAVYEKLSGEPSPTPHAELPTADLELAITGEAAPVLAELERMPSFDMLTKIQLSVVYMQGIPRTPHERLLHTTYSINDAEVALRELDQYRKFLPARCEDALVECVEKAKSLFARKRVERIETLRSVAHNTMSEDEAKRWIARTHWGRPIVDDIEKDSYRGVYGSLLAELREAKRDRKPKAGRIRSWRAEDA